jgi:hypothetical protein
MGRPIKNLTLLGEVGGATRNYALSDRGRPGPDPAAAAAAGPRSSEQLAVTLMSEGEWR